MKVQQQHPKHRYSNHTSWKVVLFYHCICFYYYVSLFSKPSYAFMNYRVSFMWLLRRQQKQQHKPSSSSLVSSLIKNPVNSNTVSSSSSSSFVSFTKHTLSSLSSSTTTTTSSHSSYSSFTQSQENLFERMEQFITQTNALPEQPQQQQNNRLLSLSSCRLVIAVAGGGSHMISTLAAIPGASKLLLEARTLYDRESFYSFVQESQQQPPSTTSTNTTTTPSDTSLKETKTKFQFASMEAATMAATAALQRALTLTVGTKSCARPHYPSLQYMCQTVGLACASQLIETTSTTEKDSSNTTATTTTATTPKNSQAYIVAQLPEGSSVQMSCTIPSTLSRRQQDVHVAHNMLTCLEYALQLRMDLYNSSIVMTMIDPDDTTHLSYSTVWQERLQQRYGISTTTTTTTTTSPLVHQQSLSGLEWTETTIQGEIRQIQMTLPKNPLLDAVQTIVTEQAFVKEKVMLFIPQSQPSQSSSSSSLQPSLQQSSLLLSNFQVIHGSWAKLPPYSVIFPGSFNPPHIGHIELARTAIQTLIQQQKQQSSSSSIHGVPNPVLWFELSLTNADKPPMEPQIALERVASFLQLSTKLQTLDIQWGILLTNAPLFVQKMKILQPLSCTTTTPPPPPPLTFVIGTDTLVRLVHPKYYENSYETMISTFQNEFPCHFMVGGRLDPQNPNTFVTGETILNELPLDIASKFTLLSNFRMDISSTELRQRQREEQQQK